MTVIVLIIMLLGVAAYVFRDKIKAAVQAKIHPGASPSVAPAQAPTGAQGPADFSPAPPAGVTPPVTPPAPPAIPVPVSQPQGGNTTDPTAPGFVMPKQPEPAPVDPVQAGFVPQPTMTFDEARGQNLPAEGSTNYVITNGPAKIRVMALQQAGSWASAFTLSVNGVSQHQDNPMSLTSITVDGPQADISVVQDGNSHLTVQVQEG